MKYSLNRERSAWVILKLIIMVIKYADAPNAQVHVVVLLLFSDALGCAALSASGHTYC